jgi:hypothetical protein
VLLACHPGTCFVVICTDAAILTCFVVICTDAAIFIIFASTIASHLLVLIIQPNPQLCSSIPLPLPLQALKVVTPAQRQILEG